MGNEEFVVEAGCGRELRGGDDASGTSDDALDVGGTFGRVGEAESIAAQ